MRRTVGWVFRAYDDESLIGHLQAGKTYLWKGARSPAKEAGQPVLFVQSKRGACVWVGRGHIVGTEERWRRFGVRVACDKVLGRGFPAVPERTPRDGPGTSALGPPPQDPNSWENLTLAHAVGIPLTAHRGVPDEVYSRDFRLTEADLYRLRAIQPRLTELWPE